MTEIVINGKFLSAKATGVHRVAEQLIAALDKKISSDPQLFRLLKPEVLIPKDAKRLVKDISFIHRKVGVTQWQFWEQFELPMHTHNNLLLSLCNLSPIISKNSITMVHDAQVYMTPESYSYAFRNWYQIALPIIGRRNKKILTVSEYSKRMLIDHGVSTEHKIEVIHNGVEHVLSFGNDENVLKKFGLQSNQYSIGLANTQKHKNIKILIEAFGHPELTHHKLVLFGGAKKQDFEAMGLTITPNVIFTGFVNDAQLRTLMEQASSIVFPSLTEGFGLPPLEAMLLGTPAICAPCGALPELCGDATTFAPPDNANSWATAVLSLLNETPHSRNNRIAAGREHAAQFTWDVAANRLCEILMDCIMD